MLLVGYCLPEVGKMGCLWDTFLTEVGKLGCLCGSFVLKEGDCVTCEFLFS